MKTLKQKLKIAKNRIDSFDPRDSLCPICKNDFRRGCNHTIEQAREKLNDNYLDLKILSVIEKNKS
jgi:hypothetical protein